MTPDQTEVVPYLTSAALIYFAQKTMKNHAAYATFVQAAPGAAKWAHRFVALVGSIIAAVGIHWTYNGTFAAGGVLTFNIPSLWDMVHAASDVIKVYVLQQMTYDVAKPKPWTPAPPTMGQGQP